VARHEKTAVSRATPASGSLTRKTDPYQTSQADPAEHAGCEQHNVREHCRSNDVPYTETSLITAWGIVVRYLNRVGLAARDSFQCPIAVQRRGL
jgi:hypothetical protein